VVNNCVDEYNKEIDDYDGAKFLKIECEKCLNLLGKY